MWCGQVLCVKAWVLDLWKQENNRRYVIMESLKSFLLSKYAEVCLWRSYSISVIEQPKRALTDAENEKIVDSLITDLEIITTESFGLELENQTSDGTRDHVVNADALAFLHDDGKVLGFASAKIFGEEKTFYLHGVAIAKSFKGEKGGMALVQALMEMTGFSRIAFTTQNPIMFCLIRSLCLQVYPCPELPVVPMELRSIGKKFLSGRPGHFNPSSFVASEIYGRCLYPNLPVSKDEIVNQWFAESLGVEGGTTRNAFLFIGNK